MKSCCLLPFGWLEGNGADLRRASIDWSSYWRSPYGLSPPLLPLGNHTAIPLLWMVSMHTFIRSYHIIHITWWPYDPCHTMQWQPASIISHHMHILLVFWIDLLWNFKTPPYFLLFWSCSHLERCQLVNQKVWGCWCMAPSLLQIICKSSSHFHQERRSVRFESIL